MDKDSFAADEKTHFAVIAQFMLIGEATKRLSEAFRDTHPEIPWRKMAGMRDVLIHWYDRVDLEEACNAVERSVPTLIAQLENIFPDSHKTEE